MSSSIVGVVARGVVVGTVSAFYSVAVFAKIVYLLITRGSRVFASNFHPRPHVLSGWSHKYIQLSEIRMHYVETGSDDKPLMVLIHGFPEFWYSYRYQLEHFKRDYHVVAIDLRGYGATDKPQDVSAYAIDRLANDVVEVIKGLSGPAGKAIVVAHDWGAAIAWTVAARVPAVVDRLVILNVPHPVAFRRQSRTWSQFRKSWYVYFFQCPLLPELLLSLDDFRNLISMFRSKRMGLVHSANFGEEQVKAWQHNFRQSGSLTPPINYYRAFVRRTILGTDPQVDLSAWQIRPKTLIIWGDKDGALNVDGAVDSLNYCDQARLVRIADASHWVQQDAPDLVNKHIEEFLAEED